MNHSRKKTGFEIIKRRFRRFLHIKRNRISFGIAVAVIAVAVVLIVANSMSSNLPVMNAAGTAEATAAVGNKEKMSSGPAETTPSQETGQPTMPETGTYTMLKQGDESSEVMLLQDRLMVLGYMDLDEPTKEFGPGTEYAVELFQRQHKLEQNGIADAELLELIYSDKAKPYTLLQGTSGNDVDALQRRLIDLGYMDKATGYYGTETIEAVKAFQDENGLDNDGKTGELTLSLIYSPNAKQSTMKPAEVARRANILEVLATAEDQLGKPYVWGAEGPNSFDCSGLIYYCLSEAGSSRGRYDAAGYSQVSDWEKITDMDNLEKGDLLFFSTNGKRVGHTGIYIGDGMMIDASSANGEVVERACKTGFWRNNFVVARRPW